MNVRKLLDWRKALLYTHRWMGIFGGLLFIAWFISGIVFMYYTMPSYTNVERLSHQPPLDLSSARIEPMEAARNNKIKPARLRVGMEYDGRPVYRFQGADAIYADTGERVAGRSAEEALDLVRQFVPQHAGTVRYDSLLDDFDIWTVQRRPTMPLHKIAVGDSADTFYYISATTGEPIMKTDRASRFWGFWGPILHLWDFTRFNRSPGVLEQALLWSSIAGSLMCLTGLVAGVWRFSISARFRQKGQHSHTPYSGWMRWHHYAGLLFGLVSLTFIFSGGLSNNPYSLFSSTNPTTKQREAASGGPIHLEGVTLEKLRKGMAAIAASFMPKEADVLQFRGELYLTAYDGPAEYPTIGLVEGRDTPLQRGNRFTPHRIVSLSHPESGTFERFEDKPLMDIAREAMPGVPIHEASFLNGYDNYYRSRDNGQPLPILRVQYADANKTWLYIDPYRGAIAWREETTSRLRRWLYNGLHKFDFPFLYDRPAWDISIIVLSIGGLVLSVTTMLPAFYRLRRHVRRLFGFGAGKRQSAAVLYRPRTE